MNLHSLLASRAAAGKPVRVAMIGAGKFGAMFLAQARRTPGLHIVGIADLDPARARTTLARIGWPDEQSGATSADDALATGAPPADALVGDLPYGRRLEPSALASFAEALPKRARRWALVAHVDLTGPLTAAGHPPRQVLEVPKPTFIRYVMVGGDA